VIVQSDVVRVETEPALADVVAVRRALARPWESGPTVEFLAHHLEISPTLALFVAYEDGVPVGCGAAGAWVPGSESDEVDADASVIPAHRRRGIGGAILRAVSAHARGVGGTALVGEAHEDDPGSLAFLARRGFEEVERQKGVALDLAAVEAPEPAAPEGIEIVTRAERSDLAEGMYAVGLEAGRDIPGRDAEHSPTFEQWRAFELDRPSRRPELSFVALDGGTVVGFASLDGLGDVAYNGLTAVARSHRRRGVARALKLRQIAAARAAGFRLLVTESEERNEPMRRLNESLGYLPIPGMVVLRGPLLA